MQFALSTLPRCTFTIMSIVYLFVSVLLLYVTLCSPMSENSSVELMFHIYHPTLNKASCILYLGLKGIFFALFATHQVKLPAL